MWSSFDKVCRPVAPLWQGEDGLLKLLTTAGAGARRELLDFDLFAPLITGPLTKH